MKKRYKIIISIIVGIILGILSEISLILNWQTSAVIMQDLGFWFLIYLVGILCSDSIKDAIATNSLIFTFMSISYYVVRIIYSNNFSVYTVRYFVILGIIGAIISGVLLKLPKKAKYVSIIFYIVCIFFFIKYYIIERTERTTGVTNFMKNFNYDNYIILSICGVIICLCSIIKIIRKNIPEKIDNMNR